MNDQNNLNSNNNLNLNANVNTNLNSNISNQQTTGVPQSETVNVNLVVPQENSSSSNNSNNNNNNQGGVFKTLFAFVFLIGLIVMVIFLPEISEFFESKETSNTSSGSSTTKTEEVQSEGTLLCSRVKVDNNEDYTYESKMVFKDKKLETIKYTTKIESYDNPTMLDRKTKCDNASNIANSIAGLTKECRLNDTVYVTIETYKLKSLNTNELNSYIEAGGTNPEYKYGQNIYDIEKDLIKKEYDCEVLSTIQEEE